MRLNTLISLLFLLLVSATGCSQTEGHYVRVQTVTDVFFQDTILNIITSDTTFRDTLFGTGGQVVGPATQTLDTIDFDFMATAANHPAGTILNPDLATKVPIVWNESPLKTSVRYGITGSEVIIRQAGWYRISGNLTTNPSTSQRYNGRVYLEKNATLSDEWLATGYSRATNDQDETTLYFEFYAQFAAFDNFKITTVCEGGQTGAGSAVTLNSSASRLFVTPLTQNFVELASGPAGQPGQPGSAGSSAYEIWLAAGNSGTVDDYLASLIGPAGPSGGPPGPPGPAGTSSDTAADGSYYRFFTTDNAGGWLAQEPFVEGTAGLEFYSSGDNDTCRIFQDVDYLNFDGEAFLFRGELYAPGFKTSPSGFFMNHYDMDFRMNSSGTVFLDTRANKKGLEYDGDYSDDLKANPRSIPDVATVQEMIDEGSAPVTNKPYVLVSASTTVSPVAGGYYALYYVGTSYRTLTLNPENLQPGDVFMVYASSSGGPTYARISSTSGNFIYANQNLTSASGGKYTMIWSGTDFFIDF